MSSSSAQRLSTLGVQASLDARSDDELMQLSAQGEEGAFETLLRRYQTVLRAFCARACGNGAGDEVVQEVFVTVWAGRHQYQPCGRFQSYLFTIAYRRTCNVMRTFARTSSALEIDVAHDDTPIEELITQQRRAGIDALLQKLPPEQRAAILLRYTAGLDYDEIAEIAGRPPSTIRARVFSGLSRLRRVLKSGDDL